MGQHRVCAGEILSCRERLCDIAGGLSVQAAKLWRQGFRHEIKFSTGVLPSLGTWPITFA